jgi:hypothetical protein
MNWTPEQELAFDVRMALSKIAGLRMTPEVREQEQRDRRAPEAVPVR